MSYYAYSLYQSLRSRNLTLAANLGHIRDQVSAGAVAGDRKRIAGALRSLYRVARRGFGRDTAVALRREAADYATYIGWPSRRRPDGSYR